MGKTLPPPSSLGSNVAFWIRKDVFLKGLYDKSKDLRPKQGCRLSL